MTEISVCVSRLSKVAPLFLQYESPINQLSTLEEKAGKRNVNTCNADLITFYYLQRVSNFDYFVKRETVAISA